MISGLGGSLVSCLTDSQGERVSVGASGALFGLLGAMLSELITNWTITCGQFCSFWRIPSWFLPRVRPSSPSAVRIREPKIHSSCK